jgi:small GTP-binding protein
MLLNKGHKTVLLGDAKAGKTQLVNRMVRGCFDVSYTPTIGIGYAALNLDPDHFAIWDASGQERFRSVVSAYLRDAKIVIFVADITVRQSLDDVNKWNDLANQRCPDAAKILVVNKTDLENQADFGTVSRSEFDAKADKLEIKHIFYVSARAETDDSGIKALKEGLVAIAREIDADSVVVAEPRTEATVTATEEEETSSLAKKLVVGTAGLGAIGGTAWCLLKFKNWFCGNQTQNLPGGEVTE